MQYCKCNHIIANVKFLIQIITVYRTMNAVMHNGLLLITRRGRQTTGVVNWPVKLSDGHITLNYGPCRGVVLPRGYGGGEGEGRM